ncbi:hypothetical protein MCOR02_011202 [Pyricularia oryzae]|uniref:Uncharacterized protein n=1 Tax=Pyricularia oryzae TaxID=318829 RepID=A0A4P7N7A0_PYROR|nr:hypothetical protein MCOR02_011202 [Pyricularia oryzae]KAI6306788.1 hypothetical protein MCOR30_011738 [Pyricularia oryzae]QBZ58547.1 hypothetical protein PoMZ_03502 [Pyricularia oryzae]
MRFIFPFVIAALAPVAFTAPLRSFDRTDGVVARGNNIYEASTGEVLGKRAAAGAWFMDSDDDYTPPTTPRTRQRQAEAAAAARQAELERQRKKAEDKQAAKEAKAARKKERADARKNQGFCGIFPNSKARCDPNA